jgi:stage II sporulation protein AA (anti-sigma F factor antagonist)
MDSSGLGLIMGRYRLASSLNGRVMVTHVSDRLDRILSMSGLYKLVQKAPDTVSALRRLEGDEAYV